MDFVQIPNLEERFSASDFQPEKYVKSILSECDMYRSLYDQRNSIQKLGETTAVALKKNVYRNYRQFIDTAKEISYLEAEMYQLSHLLTEQKSIIAEQIENDIFERPKGLPIEKDPEMEAYEIKKKDFLDSIKASKQLLKEFSSKELLFDGELTEYDTETYSPKQQIGAYLLTDNLLITTLPTAATKASIQSMFDLSDVAVVNVRDGQGVKHAFKILYSLDSRMFSAQSKEYKLAWLDQIERAKKNYRKSSVSDARRLSEVRRSMDEDDDEEEKMLEQPEMDKTNKGIKLEDFDKDQKQIDFPDFLNIEWLVELPEDLDMCIAQRDFETAVSLVEKGRSYLIDFPETTALKENRNKIETRVNQLVQILEKALDNSQSIRHVSLRSIRMYVLLLIRLGRSKLACELFLCNRGFEIKNSFKQLKIEGATPIYIKKLASVFFTAIIETGKEYKRNFPLNKNCSSFIVWVHNELQLFADKFSRQVFTRNCTLSAIANCISITLTECKRLNVIGIDLNFDLHHMFLKDVMSALFDARDQLLEKSKLKAMEDTWDELAYREDAVEQIQSIKSEMEKYGVKDFESSIENDVIKLSSSTVLFSKSVLLFIEDGLRLYMAELHDVFIQCISEIFKAQSIQFESLLKNKNLKIKHSFILKNADFVYGKVYGFIEGRLTELTGHKLKSLPSATEEMRKLRSLIS